jgi:hypothetical protein
MDGDVSIDELPAPTVSHATIVAQAQGRRRRHAWAHLRLPLTAAYAATRTSVPTTRFKLSRIAPGTEST